MARDKQKELLKFQNICKFVGDLLFVPIDQIHMQDINVTELARKLKIPTKDLLERLPEMGFSIGKKAIKINGKMAQEIIKKWDILNKMYEGRLKLEREEESGGSREKAKEEEARTVLIPAFITVREFAERSEVPVPQVIQTLMKNGIFASLNERIDFDTAQIIGDDLGLKIEEDKEDLVGAGKKDEQLIKILEGEKNLQPRPPVVVIMGHVDHGKTRLLDTIRKTNVVEGEAGGITQHIGAYQVKFKDKKISFIDTPGHEAFTAMRSRGARIADIAILIVAADDSIKPQTIEALRIIEQAQLPIIVAINKIDKPDANIDRVKSDLAQNNLNPEEWGGKTIVAEISAMTGQGVDDLLEMVLLVAEENQDKIQANPKGQMVGTVIESHVDKGEGPVATVLVQNGTLKTGGYLGVGGTFYGRVRAMKDWDGKTVSSAEPSSPVKILGFKVSPKVGDIVVVVKDQKELKKKIAYQDIVKDRVAAVQQTSQSDDDEDEGMKKFNIFIKADTLGSLEAIIESLEKIHNPEIRLKVAGKGLGNITESDVLLAESSGALVVAFHVKPTPNAEKLARDKKVEVIEYKVIYDLLDEVKKRLEDLLGEEIIREEIGKIEVLLIFSQSDGMAVAGGKVTEGKIAVNSKAKIFRTGIELGEGEITSLRIGKESVVDVEKGNECGFGYKGKTVLEKDDVLHLYREKRKDKKL